MEDFGISINSDVVVRTQFFKYFHPKECFVSNGVLNRGLMQGGGDAAATATEGQQLNFVYPYGATLNVKEPAIPGESSYSKKNLVAFLCLDPKLGKTIFEEKSGQFILKVIAKID